MLERAERRAGIDHVKLKVNVRVRSDPTGINQRHSGDQPCFLTDANPPSPDSTVSNPSDVVPPLGIKFIRRKSLSSALAGKGQRKWIWTSGPCLRKEASNSERGRNRGAFIRLSHSLTRMKSPISVSFTGSTPDLHRGGRFNDSSQSDYPCAYARALGDCGCQKDGKIVLAAAL